MSDNEVSLGVEQFLAAILYKIGSVEITKEELIANYSQYAVAIDPTEAGDIRISLVDLKGVDLEEIAE